jgi:glutaconate CoA-transferase subunit B
VHSPSPPFRGEREGPAKREGEAGSGERSGIPHLTPTLSAPWGGEGDTACGRGGILAEISPGLGKYTASELLAVVSARLLRDGQVVFAGVGIPLLAATLAQRRHAPGLTILFEGGTVGAFVEPGKLPPSTNEQRCTRRANMVLGSTDVLLLLQRGYVDVGFMGGAQIDQYGNLNSSFIGDPGHPATRLPGTGGGNDIASLTQMIVAMKHEKRRFVDRVDFVTSPGFLLGEDSRRAAGLTAGGMFRVVTDLGLLGFDERSHRMKLLALHPGVSADQVQENTGFALLIEAELPTTDPPTENELAVLRHLDPERLYTA